MAAVFQYMRNELEAFLGDHQTTLTAYVVHLFTNNHTPTPGDSLGAYTETTYPSYAAQTLGALTGPSLSGDIAYLDSGTITFPVVAGPTSDIIYGYFVTDSGGTVLKFAELLDTPLTPVVGFPILLQIRLRARNP